MPEESHKRADFANNAILWGLSNSQNDRKIAFSLAEGATHVDRWKNSRKTAFTEPSRGMSEAKVEQTSAETLSFRCVCERCRLMRGEVNNENRKVAFTLAEVLITLGIIGVVAAITMPMVIANYNKKVYSTRLKAFYTSMSQAILASESVNGPKEYWGVEPNNNEKMLDVFNTYITPYLNLISKPTKRKRSFTMTNGVVVSLYSGSCTDLYTDLNGDKKPNKIGVDIYYFTICTFYKPPLEPYLYNTGLYSRSQLLDKCKTNPSFCSSLLFYDEWEYKKDYPYKLR